MKSQKEWPKRRLSGLAIAMNILFPRIPRSRWPAMIGITFLGASVAGLYGIVHDQVTFSISQEYFTRLKFTQFRWANIGLPTRIFVAEIGFLATWWVGLIAGWVLARTSAEAVEPRVMLRLSVRGFALVIGCALAAAVIHTHRGTSFTGLGEHPLQLALVVAQRLLGLFDRDVSPTDE